METKPLLLDPFSYFIKDYRVCVAISRASRFVHSVKKYFCINSIVMLIGRSTVKSFSFLFQANSSHFISIISLDEILFFFTIELESNSQVLKFWARNFVWPKFNPTEWDTKDQPILCSHVYFIRIAYCPRVIRVVLLIYCQQNLKWDKLGVFSYFIPLKYKSIWWIRKKRSFETRTWNIFKCINCSTW